MDLGSWEGCNFYQIRPASETCNFYKIRPEIGGQLLQFKARFRIYPSAAFGGRFLGSNFRLVRLDLGPVQDFGIPVREHSARIKTSKNEFWGVKIRIFLGLQAPVSVLETCCRERQGRPGAGTQHGGSSFYRFIARSTAFTK